MNKMDNKKLGISLMIVSVLLMVLIVTMNNFNDKDNNSDKLDTYSIPLILEHVKDPENIIYEGKLLDGKIHGDGELYYFGNPLGFLASGTFENGTLEKGVFSLTFAEPEQDKSYSVRNEGFFDEKGLTGEGSSKIEIVEDGYMTSIYLNGNFENGRLNGLGKMTVYTAKDGKIYEASGEFKKGVIQKGGAVND